MEKLDSKLADVINNAIREYVAGHPYAIVGFDILRTQDHPSMEPVYMFLMSDKDHDVISLMMKLLHHHDQDVKERIYQAFLSNLEEIRDNR